MTSEFSFILIFWKNKIEGTPILKFALVKRFKILIKFKNKKDVKNMYHMYTYVPQVYIPQETERNRKKQKETGT